MGITIRRLAQLAGVSHVTVLRALHGRDAVSERTRRHVIELARKHHFPLPPTRATESQDRLNALCSMIDTQNDIPPSNQGFSHRLLAGLIRGVAACGAELMNVSGPSETEWPLVVNRRQVDGVVMEFGDELAPHPPLPAPVPMVLIFAGPPQADVVTVANFDGGRLLGAHLAELGHRRVAYLGLRSSMSLERLAGLRTALEQDGGSTPPECVTLFQQSGGREFTTEMLDRLLARARAANAGANGFTALACYNDYLAAAAILHLRERGVRVPEDVSVIGFDHVRPVWYDGPALTTVAMPLEEIGAEAVRLLYWRLAHPDAPPRRLVLNAPLVAGETTRAVKTVSS
jgi:DNA-binding LacI/PurR family transcriptional regulator